MPGALDELKVRLGRINDLGRAAGLAAWDERTQMPPGGAPARAEQLGTLAELGHELLVDDELAALIERAGDEVAELGYDSDDASLVRVARREIERARRVPTELSGELARAASQGENAWVKARAESDFEAFRPHLERNIELRRRYVECFAPYDHPYDPLLDEYEPGLATVDLERVLATLRDGLRPLVERYAGTGDDGAFMRGNFPTERQQAMAERILAGIPIPADQRRLDPTAHPFMSAIAPTDLRITTRYDEDNLAMAVWSLLHECGHAMYENGVPPELASLVPVGEGLSLGFHESQSRLLENWVGRSRQYLSYLLPVLREFFPEAFRDVDAERLYRAANRVERSLIRVEADEVTYNLHIILRFELEVALISGGLEVRDLPEAWNQRMHDYLGVEVPDDASGVLQDVHWAAGVFGYFPTYALGNVIAGQLWEIVRTELPDLDDQLARGDLVPLRDWLRERLYRHGAKFQPAEMIKRITGGPLDAAPLLAQLEAKQTEIAAAV